MKKKRKKTPWGLLFILLLIIGLAVYAYFYVQKIKSLETSRVDLTQFQQEQVKRGTITTGVVENGTVALGEVSQMFDLTDESASMVGAATASAGSSTGSNARSNQGNVGESQQAAVSSGTSISLIVEEVYVTTGQRVNTGDKILKLTQQSINKYRNNLEANITTAELNVKAEEINLESKKAESEYTYQMNLAKGEVAEETYQATLQTLADAITKTEEEIAEKQEEIDTYQSYVDYGYGYEEELEEAQKSLETLQANLLIQQNNQTTGAIEAKQTYETAVTNYKYADQLYAIDTDGLEDSLNEAKDALQDAEDALSEFEEKIGDGYLYAQQEGMVTEIAYATGDILSNNGAVVTFVNESDVTMSVYVSQEDVGNISIGDAVTILLDAYPNQEFAGVVSGISTTAAMGSATVNYEVKVVFTDQLDKVYSGMTGDVSFAGKTVTDTLYISNRAVTMDGASSMVKVLEPNGNVSDVEIKTGFSDGTIVAVESGLEEDQIVLLGR